VDEHTIIFQTEPAAAIVAVKEFLKKQEPKKSTVIYSISYGSLEKWNLYQKKSFSIGCCYQRK